MRHAEILWFDGKIIPWHKGKIHIMNAGVQYGLNPFDHIRFYNTPKGPALFRAREHYERLQHSASTLHILVRYAVEELINGTKELVRQSAAYNGSCRPIITCGDEATGLYVPLAKEQVHVGIGLYYWEDEQKREPIRMHISPLERIDNRNSDPSIKVAGNYLQARLAYDIAKAKGFDDAILLCRGYVTEATGANIWIVKRGELLTPVEGAILPGITRDTIMTLAEDRG